MTLTDGTAEDDNLGFATLKVRRSHRRAIVGSRGSQGVYISLLVEL